MLSIFSRGAGSGWVRESFALQGNLAFPEWDVLVGSAPGRNTVASFRRRETGGRTVGKSGHRRKRIAGTAAPRAPGIGPLPEYYWPARCDSADEAVLLILLGQKEFRSNEEATGAEIMDGLVQSGYRLSRVDNLMNKLTAEGSVITIGVHRGRRYRLTNIGLLKALDIARDVVATVP